jgi:hypothetical protein
MTRFASLLIVIGMSVPFAVSAAEFPKRGEAEFITYATIRALASIDSNAGAGGVWDYVGVMQNVKGDGPFNNMVAHCLINWTKIGEQMKTEGSCVLTDPDGDTIFDTNVGTAFTLAAGTGKYKGISGQGTISRTALHDLSGGEKATINRHRVVWEIN